MKSVLRYIQRQAELNGSAIAFHSDERSVTYNHLMARSAVYRDCLLAAGIKPTDRVGVALSDDMEAMAAIIGIWACQATAVPIDFRNRKSQRKMTFEKFGLSVILEERISADAEYRGLTIEHFPALGCWIDVAIFDTAPAFIAETSGTAGLSSGIVISHECYCHRLEVYHLCYSLNPTSKNLVAYPISFAASRTLCIMTLMYGGQNCIAPLLASGEELVEFIDRNEVTEAYIVPTTLEVLLNAGADGSLDSLRYLAFGSAPASEPLKNRALDTLKCDLIEVYSATSTGALSFHTSQTLVARPETVGKIFEGVEVQIVDMESRILGCDQVGLIRTKGPALVTEVIGGHLSGDFLKDGWAYPGDLGSIGADGFLTLAGRSSEVIVRGGEKINPMEVESALLLHPMLLDVAVLAIPHPTLGEQVAALICSKEPELPEDLRAHCVNRLSSSKVPSQFKLVAKIPRNPNGKIMRNALISLFQDEVGQRQ